MLKCRINEIVDLIDCDILYCNNTKYVTCNSSLPVNVLGKCPVQFLIEELRMCYTYYSSCMQHYEEDAGEVAWCHEVKQPFNLSNSKAHQINVQDVPYA